MTGRRLGHFEILEQLGSGGMGEVYKARDLELERLVALKVLPASATENPDRKRRFGFEARAASALNHPNIITIYEIASVEGCAFIAMELVEGKTLEQMLRDGMLPVENVVQYAVQVADALAAAHAGQIVHRDLKPGNVMVTARGMVKVLDFGVAKLNDFGQSDPDGQMETMTAHTQHGAIVGTLAYMSPEQARGKELDARTDIFSFGALLYEMATGRQAFSGNTSAEIFEAILNRAPVAPMRLNPDIPTKLEDVINKALEKDRNLRYQHAADLRSDLQRLKRDTESGHTAVGTTEA